MIYFNFDIRNPWSDRWNTIWFKSGLLGKHKSWEFNGYRTHHIIDVNFNLTFNCDHAGLYTMFGLFGYALEFSVYDTRHWNHQENRWEIYD